MKQLTARQKVFADEYLIDLNATQAAIRAGYSKKTAEWIGPQLLTKTHVSMEIALRMKARERRTEITQDRVLAEYAKLAFLDPRRFYDDSGVLKPVHLLDADVAAALVGVDVTDSYDKESQQTVTTKKVKFADKKGALDSVARHLGMFTDKVMVSADVTVKKRAADYSDDELLEISMGHHAKS
jgi:phage terminase small subunit